MQALPNNGTEVPDEMARTCRGATSVGPSRRGESLGHLGRDRSTIGGSSSGYIIIYNIIYNNMFAGLRFRVCWVEDI